MARLPINCCWRPIDGGEKPDLLASQLLEFIAIDTCSGRCLMAKIRVIRKATRSFRLGQMLFKTRTREIELQILPGATQRPVIIFAAVTGDHRSVMRSATLAFKPSGPCQLHHPIYRSARRAPATSPRELALVVGTTTVDFISHAPAVCACVLRSL